MLCITLYASNCTHRQSLDKERSQAPQNHVYCSCVTFSCSAQYKHAFRDFGRCDRHEGFQATQVAIVSAGYAAAKTDAVTADAA